MTTRFPKRLILIVLMVVILGIQSMGVQAAVPQNVVVFLSGVCTSLADGIGPSTNFSTLQQYLKLSTFGYTADDLLAYSYKGGRMEMVTLGGKIGWHHFAYDELTPINQPYTTSLLQLNNMLNAYRAVYPNTKFILVGHSLGGFLAMEYIKSYGSTLISKIITVDSPLQGNPLQITNWPQWTTKVKPCATGQVGNSNMAVLTNRYKLYNYFATWYYSPAIVSAKSTGVQFYTTGNNYDGLYTPSYCGVPTLLTGAGNKDVQWLPDTTKQVFSLPVSSVFSCIEDSHGAATTSAYAAYIMAYDIGHK